MWPGVIEQTANGRESYDLPSRLLKDRIVLVQGEIEDSMATSIVAQLLFLEAQDPTKEISMYINSPGGSVTAGLSITDTMNFIKPDVATYGIGLQASMGAFLLAAGAKGKRYALPYSRIMIHQPWGGAQGQATDVEIHAREILRQRELLNEILAANTGQSLAKIQQDTDRDYFMSSEQAKDYGLVDAIMARRSSGDEKAQ